MVRFVDTEGNEYSADGVITLTPVGSTPADPDLPPVPPVEPDPDPTLDLLYPPTTVVFERSVNVATISWEAPRVNAAKVVTGYRVARDGVDLSGSGPWSKVLPATRYSFTFLGLDPRKGYELTVQAVYAAGSSEPIAVTVAPDPPDAPPPVDPLPDPAPARRLIVASSGTASLSFGSSNAQALDALAKVFGGKRPAWISNGQHLQINGGTIRQRYVRNHKPIGSPPSDVVSFALAVGAHRELYCSYVWDPEDDFQWVQGGKLPGFVGGTRPTGGSGDPNGMSARFMFETGGHLVAYVYHPGDPSKFGDSMELSGVRMTPGGGPYQIASRIAIGSRSTKGVVEAWFDGSKKLSRNIQFIAANTTKPYLIDYLLYSSFFGGNRPSNAPPAGGCHASFGHFKVGMSLADVL